MPSGHFGNFKSFKFEKLQKGKEIDRQRERKRAREEKLKNIFPLKMSYAVTVTITNAIRIEFPAAIISFFSAVLCCAVLCCDMMCCAAGLFPILFPLLIVIEIY